jgi:hypothetical protein
MTVQLSAGAESARRTSLREIDYMAEKKKIFLVIGATHIHRDCVPR